MTLIYLSEANLRDKNFIHDFAFHFDKKGSAIVVHDIFGTSAEDTRFVTRRLSAVLSESLVVNIQVSGDQRNLISGDADNPVLNAKIFDSIFRTAPVFITNRLLSGTEFQAAYPASLLNELRKKFAIESVLFFPANSRSPIALSPVSIASEEDFERILSVYEEERPVLELALALMPSKIVSPANMKA